LGPELLGDALKVVANQGVGGGENRRHAAVILLKQGQFVIGPGSHQPLDVGEIRAAPAINRLVFIADHRQPPGRVAGQHLCQPVLHRVGVLKLIDQDVGIAFLIAAQDAGVALEQQHRVQNQIIEIDGVGRQQAALVDHINIAPHFGRVVGFSGRAHGLVARQVAVVFPAGNHFGGPVNREPLGVEIHFLDDAGQQVALVPVIVNGEVGIERPPAGNRQLLPVDGGGNGPFLAQQGSHHPRLIPQHPCPETVEGAGGDSLGLGRGQQPGQPLFHLAGRFVGEGNCQDVSRIDALLDQPGDAMH